MWRDREGTGTGLRDFTCRLHSLQIESGVLRCCSQIRERASATRFTDTPQPSVSRLCGREPKKRRGRAEGEPRKSRGRAEETLLQGTRGGDASPALARTDEAEVLPRFSRKVFAKAAAAQRHSTLKPLGMRRGVLFCLRGSCSHRSCTHRSRSNRTRGSKGPGNRQHTEFDAAPRHF
ncbi:MAG: hypothetical protein RIR10_1841 [Planctomycetota bacterium]